jgi:hypothetical protein
MARYPAFADKQRSKGVFKKSGGCSYGFRLGLIPPYCIKFIMKLFFT